GRQSSKTIRSRLRGRQVRAAGPALLGRHANLRAALETSAHLRSTIREALDALEAELPGRGATEAAHRAKGEGHEELRARKPRRHSGGQRPARGQEQRLKDVDSDDPSEKCAHEAKGAEERRPAGEHADTKQGEGEIEVSQLALREEQDWDARKECKPDGSENCQAEPCEWVTNGCHRSSEAPCHSRRTTSTCRHRYAELIITSAESARDPR